MQVRNNGVIICLYDPDLDAPAGFIRLVIVLPLPFMNAYLLLWIDCEELSHITYVGLWAHHGFTDIIGKPAIPGMNSYFRTYMSESSSIPWELLWVALVDRRFYISTHGSKLEHHTFAMEISEHRSMHRASMALRDLETVFWAHAKI